MTVDQRLSALRTWMRDHKLDAYIVPSSDPHQSEYVADKWKSREWISGFTGSAGTAVITHDHAGIWTDGRYYLQADQELSRSEYQLHKLTDTPYAAWLTKKLQAGQTVGIDGQLFSQRQVLQLRKRLSQQDINLAIDKDAMPAIREDILPLPNAPIYAHDIQFAGKSRADKLAEVRAEMNDKGADYHLVTTLDDIAWMLNVRGSDVSYNPVAVSYFVLGAQDGYLFIDESKVPDTLAKDLKADGIVLLPYTDIVKWLNEMSEQSSILLDPAICNAYLYRSANGEVIDGRTPAKYLKAIKNEVEVANTKNAHLRDAVALTHAFKWLEDTLKSENVTEATFADKIAECRSQQEHYVGESFSAIIGYKGNGAIIHYHPTHEACDAIQNEGMLLCDSGGQYLDGTTDITRTITFTEPTAMQKKHYTLVLKGMIALSQARFPKGTTGIQLDTFARQYLWAEGLNYAHGTGHGVGVFLNVHEPPQGFAPNMSERSTTAHKSGMISSNEPGYYLEDQYGIRIENLLVARESQGSMYFETIAFFPIDTQLVDLNIMTQSEKDWLNAYHQETFDKISGQLDEAHKAWLQDKCQEI